MDSATKTPVTCRTCLYCATHDNCDGCLSGHHPDMKYANWKKGNWMGRLLWFELQGKRNIVIGHQGEAEVNVKSDPKATTKHLHYVSEQCGYMTRNLIHHKDGTHSVKITTTEGIFRLVWDSESLLAIECWNYDYDYDTDTDNSKCIAYQWERDKAVRTLESLNASDDPTNQNYKD